MKPVIGQDKANKSKRLSIKRHSLQITRIRTLSEQDGQLAVQSMENSPVLKFIADDTNYYIYKFSSGYTT